MTTKLTLSSAILAVCAVFVSTPSMAQDKPMIPGTFSANVALTSEYYFRGISQTDDAPALQGGLDYELEIIKPVSIYAGVWGSNVDFNEASTTNATVELDWYGGLKGTIGSTGLSWDAGFIYYSYPGAASGRNYDFWEIQGKLGYDFGIAAVTGSLNYSPENFGKSGDAYYYKFAVDVPVPAVKGLSFSGYIAEQDVQKNAVFGSPDYVEWNLGVTYNVLGWFDASINYSDTDIKPSADGKGEAVLFTVSRSF